MDLQTSQEDQMIEEVNKDTKKKTINLKVQYVLLEQRAPRCF